MGWIGAPARPGTAARAGETAAASRPAVRLALVGLATLVAEVLRFHALDREPFWFDEAYTALSVQLPVAGILERLRGEGNAPLYYLLMHFWSALFGDGVYSFRALSALLGTLAVPVVYAVAARLFSPPAALIAAALAAVTPLHVHYSQEARMYPLVALLAVLALHALHRLIVAPGVRPAFAFAAVVLAGLYTQYYFLFLLPLAGFALWSPDRRRSVAFTALALALVAIGFAPWVPSFLDQASNPSSDWIGGFWHERSLALAVPWSLQALGPGASYPAWSTFKLASSAASGAVSSALAALVIGGAVWQLAAARGAASAPAARPAGEPRDPARAWSLTLAAVLVPLVLACAATLVRRPIYVVARYDMIAWGAYCILAGAVLARLPRPLRAACLALWIATAAWTLFPHVTSERPKRHLIEMGDQVAAELLERARPGETVVFTTATRTMAQYYLRHDLGRFQLLSFPLGTDEHLGWIDTRVQTDPRVAAEEAARFAARVLDVPSPPEVVWVVDPRSPGTGPLLAELERRGYAADPERSLGLILLCLRRAPATG